MLKLRQLEVFREVMLRGTVTEAAKRLQMSQPAATNALHQLERRLGFKLFARVRGRLNPTLEARSLHREVEKIFGTVDIVEKYAHDLKDAQSGLLTLAATPTLTAGIMARAVARLRVERPGVRVWLHATALTREAVDLATEGRIDLGVVHTPTNESGVTVEVLFETAMVCAVRRDHPLAKRIMICSRDLVGIPVITNIRNEHITSLLERALPALDLRHEVVIGANQAVTGGGVNRLGGDFRRKRVRYPQPCKPHRLSPSLLEARHQNPRIGRGGVEGANLDGHGGRVGHSPLQLGWA